MGMSFLQMRSSAAALAVLGTLAVTVHSAGAQGTLGARPPAAPVAGEAKASADSARYPYTAADVHFMSAMIGHHAQAIVMANLAPTHGASPAVRRLADRIINAQQDEIATMQGWLRDRRQPVPEARPMGAMQMDGMKHEMSNDMKHDSSHAMAHPMAHDMAHDVAHDTKQPARVDTAQASSHAMLMPGMLTDAQMHQLEQASGAEFDRLFLTYMIQHHRGATSMVQTLFGTYGAAQDEVVFKFASDVNVDQTTEIARMEQMLAALPSAPRTP